VSATGPSHDEIIAAIKESGGRVTPTKRALVDALIDAEGHLTADELTSAVERVAPDVSPSTVYRNLEELEELGIVVHTHLGRPAAVYHLAGPVHGHLACARCGYTIEVPPALFENLARTAMLEYGFDVDRHHLAISGRCIACQSAD
jgi:Fur family transcriptional regulator, ferric uptake regulator